MAISLMALFAERKAGNAVVLDFDLHYGDGTVNCFSGDSRVLYLHPEESTPGAFLDRVTRDLALAGPRDILAVSAGFDRGKHDWGNLLGEDDYRTMGGLLKDYAAAQCGGRRYALLEGGYHHGLMGKYVQAFLEGFA
jgi:acetoin utilization deacetylase AcuC-like enzyme